MQENYRENANKIIDIVKESKSTPTGCYFDEHNGRVDVRTLLQNIN